MWELQVGTVKETGSGGEDGVEFLKRIKINYLINPLPQVRHQKITKLKM